MADYLSPGMTGDDDEQTDAASDDANSSPNGAVSGKNLLDSAKLAAKWNQELQASKKWMAKFMERARKCERAYIDESDGGTITHGRNMSRINLFWSNVEVTLAAIYGRMPQATVDRKFRDFDDDVARVAAEMMQRILNSDIAMEYDDTAAAMRDAVQDRFIVGLGQCWCRYDCETEEYQVPAFDPQTGQPAQADPDTGAPATQTAIRILDENACTDYVYWEDFRYAPCRRWRDCRWVARAVLMSKERLQTRFHLTPAQLGMVPMTSRSASGSNQEDVLKATPFPQARVWEIWDRDSLQVIWYAEGCNYVLDAQDDILGLEDFFPCPQPVVATTLTKAFLPKADYIMAQDLYEELNDINSRLASLERAVKAVGVRDKNAKGLERMMQEACENEMIPVENWSSFVEKGGLKGITDWMPIDQFVNAITQLTQRKQQLQNDLYELLGISDIMRGASVASETATAQELKAAYGGARLSKMQEDVARFVSDIMRIRADIIASHFQPDTIKRRSLIMRTPDAPYADAAIALLKNEGLAEHSIKVDADTLAAPDWEMEKKTRTEFMGAVSNYVMAAAPMMAQNSDAGVFLLKLLQWGAAGFKGSESIEGVIDQAVKSLEAKAMQPPPPPPPPSPEDQKNSAAAQKNQAEAAKVGAQAQAQQMQNQAVGAVLARSGVGPNAPAPGAPGSSPGIPTHPIVFPGAPGAMLQTGFEGAIPIGPRPRAPTPIVGGPTPGAPMPHGMPPPQGPQGLPQ